VRGEGALISCNGHDKGPASKVSTKSVQGEWPSDCFLFKKKYVQLQGRGGETRKRGGKLGLTEVGQGMKENRGVRDAKTPLWQRLREKGEHVELKLLSEGLLLGNLR